MYNSRRNFIKKSVVVSSSLPFLGLPLQWSFQEAENSEDLDISIFSKHLQFLDYKEAGEISAELGFNGIDLTVRPKGHVLPEYVSKDLPKAIGDIKKSGLHCNLITTAIESVTRPEDVNIIETAGQNGVSFYRANWFKYAKNVPFNESLIQYQKQLEDLGKLNKKNNISGCYQNHSGTSIGASFWEIHKLLETVDPKYFGVQYDIRHATVEGGNSWVNGLELLHNQIQVIVLKDFKWGQENGEWKPINVPIGEGMVNFQKYFKLLKSYGLKPPVSLHLEYPLGGAEKGNETITVDKKVVFDAMRKDLDTIKKMWKQTN